MPQVSPDFQSIIFALQRYWADWGCTLWQPYYSQVGAGTMNPATFLRVLGPEPWNVAYVEPSVRPDDGRYGENPNRLQQHYQFQAILKPDPGDPQEIYLRSLEAIGVDVHKHDIRFVEDNWTSPALGAWGLGWEVWLDGLEITQFTYFQQAGGQVLDPVSVEITYGLDRIAMALQGVPYVGELRWSPKRTWGDLNLQGEREHSRYYFELADVQRLRTMYDLFEEEAQAALDAGLILPAHDYVLKCSHTFNILDARGAVGVTERQAYFRRMRRLSGGVAQAYVEERERQKYPWLEEETEKGGAASKPPPVDGSAKLPAPSQAADFLLEIGTEELPPDDLDAAIKQLATNFEQTLDNLFLEHDSVSVQGAPRRLVVHISNLAAKQPDREELVKGPPAARAFDKDGSPTQAAEGFARGQGLSAADLKIEKMDGGEYVVAHVRQKGQSAVQVLALNLPNLIASLSFEHTMRWNESGTAFSRPIRWLVALHGEHLVPFEYAGLRSTAQSRGLRLSEGEGFKVRYPEDYFAQLKTFGVILDVDARRAAIGKQVDKLAGKAGGTVAKDIELLDEVTHLVEAPRAVLGEFDAGFLALPPEVLIAVMKKHQRYFPLEKNGKLLNAFIVVGNGRFDSQAVTEGNEDVLRARFADAAYFVKRDRQRSLESYVADLKQLTFQKDLGSMWDKTQRLLKLIEPVAGKLGLSKKELDAAERAALLAKADLATQMVIEMTSLQGVMGRHYALDSVEPKEVADAISEHYLPRFSGDEIPQSKVGLALGLADRLDTLTGLFAVGLAPTGAKDPFAQRRAAIGLVQSLWGAEQEFDLAEGIAWAAEHLPMEVSAESRVECLEFIIGRMRSLLLEQDARYDVVDAVLAARGRNPAAAAHAVEELSKHVGHKAWPKILDAYARCVRITRDLKETYQVNEKLFSEKAEKTLYNAIMEAESAERASGSVDDFLKAFIPTIQAIDIFFDEVLVMVEEEKIRQNRLALLQRIVALADGVADFSKMEGF